MGRRKKFTFKEPKMFSARVEASDLEKVQEILFRQGKTVQDFLNEQIRLYISGSTVLEDNNE